MLKELSADVARLVADTRNRLVHIGGSGISGRTGLVWSDNLVVTLAREARDGESVSLLLADGRTVASTVRAYDARTGLVLLEASGLPSAAWQAGDLPSVGSLVVTVAFPSPGGVEAKLETVRYVGGETGWGRGGKLRQHLQTDGAAFPGFGGAALLDPEGRFVAFLAENRPGNSGFAIAYADLAEHVATLLAKGTRRKAYLGINTKPTGTDQGLAVTEVEKGSPADTAGLKPGDLLLSLAGHALAHPIQLVEVLAGLEAGAAVEARVLRKGEVHTLTVVPGGR